MTEKIKLLKQLGFSDDFLKIIERQDTGNAYPANMVEPKTFQSPIEVVCPDTTGLIIEKTEPPVPHIYKTVPN